MTMAREEMKQYVEEQRKVSQEQNPNVMKCEEVAKHFITPTLDHFYEWNNGD